MTVHESGLGPVRLKRQWQYKCNFDSKRQSRMERRGRKKSAFNYHGQALKLSFVFLLPSFVKVQAKLLHDISLIMFASLFLVMN